MGFLIKRIDLDAGRERSGRGPQRVACPECKGARTVLRYAYNPAKGIKGVGGGPMSTYVDCPDCQGRGTVTR